MLREERSKIVVQVPAGGVQIDGFAQFGGGLLDLARETQDARKRPMRFGAVWRKSHGFASFALGGVQVSFLCECVGEIDMCLGKGRLQFQGGVKFDDRCIDLALGEQNPSERVVSLGTGRRETNSFLESGPRGFEISALESRHSFLISRTRRRGCRTFLLSRRGYRESENAEQS